MKQFKKAFLLLFFSLFLQSPAQPATATYDFAAVENCRIIAKDLAVVLSFTESTSASITMRDEITDQVNCYIGQDEGSGKKTFTIEQVKDINQKTPLILEIPAVSNITTFLSGNASLLIKKSVAKEPINVYLNLISGGHVHIEKNILPILGI